MTEVSPDTEAVRQDERPLNSLQYKYLSVYLIVMGSDWLQGPYQYKLYQSYGFDIVQIAFLFLTGFMSGAVGGTMLGSTADIWGRRRVCLIFCATSFLACMLRLWSNYYLLLASHTLSGMAAAMLFSVFEAWYVAEHTSHNIPSEWMSRTFARATFLNGLIAIVAGLVANAVVSVWGFKAPYVVAMGLLVSAASLIGSTWGENYGEPNATDHYAHLMRALIDGLAVMWRDSNILVLCAAQTMFECSMYIFVLLYTPAIENAAAIYSEEKDLPFGYLFSTMMVMVMLGSYTFQKLSSTGPVWLNKSRILTLALLLASVSFFMMVYKTSTSMYMLLLGFHLFEFSTGIYYPSLSSLKANVIPEETRAAVMTILRIPMNLGVGIIMWHVDSLSLSMMFAICATMTLTGAFSIVLKFKPQTISSMSSD